MISGRIASGTVAVALGLSLAMPRPAAANGAASTRNIIFGAAAVGGTLLILNHNKKVHQKYAEYDRRQAQTESQANQAQAAYESERAAYGHEAALVGEFQREVAYQHTMVRERDKQIAALEHSLEVAKGYRPARVTAYVPQPRARAAVSRHRSDRPVIIARSALAPQIISYGWGTY